MHSLGYIIYLNTTMRYIDLGLENITFYVEKHRAATAICSNPPLVRDKSAFWDILYISHYERAPAVWWLGARAFARGQAVIRQGQYLDGWPELITRFLNTTPARLFGLDSEFLMALHRRSDET